MPESAILRSCTLAAALCLAACDAPGTPTELRPQSIAFSASADATQLVELRRVTARFANFDVAEAAGYEEKITPCWAHAEHGAMGYHYANMSLFDAVVELLRPEALMYEPNKSGHLQLTGMEYIVPFEAWAQAGHDLDDPTDVPVLLGQSFAPHSFLPIFKLHIWLWRDNPEGTFADWNPKVSCASAPDTEIFQ